MHAVSVVAELFILFTDYISVLQLHILLPQGLSKVDDKVEQLKVP